MSSAVSWWPSLQEWPDRPFLPADTLCYTDARQRVGVSKQPFYEYVKKGLIRKVPVLGLSRQAYLIADVVALAQQREQWLSQPGVRHVSQAEAYTLAQVMTCTGLKKSTIFGYVKAGKVRQVAVPGQGMRYLRGDIDTLAAQLEAGKRILSQYYTRQQAIERLNVSLTQLKVLLKDGVLRKVSVPGIQQVGVNREDVDALAACHENVVHTPDPDQFSHLYAAFHKLGVAYLWHQGLTVQEAEDLVQDEFTYLWATGGDFFALVYSPGGAMMHRLKHRLYEWKRKRRHRLHRVREMELEPVSWCHPQTRSVEDHVIDRERLVEVMAYCRQRLPHVLQVVVQLVALGYTSHEIWEYLAEHHDVTWTEGTTTFYRNATIAQVRRDLVATQAS